MPFKIDCVAAPIRNEYVAFDSKAEILYVTIPFSKTDQLGHTTTLILKRSVHTSVCPLNLMLNYFPEKGN
jgi:hypothetical protein